MRISLDFPLNVSKIPLRAYLILIGSQLAVGAAAIFARFALHGAGACAASALRLTIAAIPLAIYSWFANGKLSILWKHEIVLALAGVFLAVHFSAWIGSLLYASVAASTLLVSTAPVWTVLYDALVLKHRTTLRFWIAFFAGAGGVILIATAKSTRAPITGLAPFGDFLAMTGGLAFALYLIAIRSLSKLYPTTLIVARTYSWAAFALWIAALITHQELPGNDPISWSGIIAMAIVSQMIGHTGLNASLRSFMSSTVAFSTLLEPVFAAALAVIIFGEELTIQTLFGSVIVLIALSIILKLQSADKSTVLVDSGL
jgi:drug/metabolite transporter (DMT)-like permease